MPLIDELPPSVRPEGQGITRRPACRCGAVTLSQVSGPLQRVGAAAGMAISGASSGGPASSTRTLVDGSSLRRAATTLPALPAPTMM
jgi:hypothetical protein